MKTARDTINETLRLVSEGSLSAARSLLENDLNAAVAQGVPVPTLARHGAVLAEQADDLVAVKRYYELAARHEPDDALLELALGDVCLRLGEREAGRAHLIRGVTLASSGGDPDVLELLRRRLARL